MIDCSIKISRPDKIGYRQHYSSDGGHLCFIATYTHRNFIAEGHLTLALNPASLFWQKTCNLPIPGFTRQSPVLAPLPVLSIPL